MHGGPAALEKNMSIVIDVVFVLFLVLMFFFGYRKGFLNKAWWLVDIALTAGLCVLLLPTLNNSLTNAGLYGKLESLFSSLVGGNSPIKLDAAEAASVVQSVIICIGLGIIVIIVMAIVKALLKGLRKYIAFKIIDGVLGGVYSIVITAAVLMVIGVLAGTFVPYFGPVSSASDLCSECFLFKYIFGANPFQEFVNGKFPLGSWVAQLFH